ncbi:MAG: hypothetical protein O3A10_12625 [Chloroflexi bacterium]|nr:hypothetical protein [Chloroflexota bacterium]MDA1147396.1 hypothetical protein [Chloroflexota bacterium]
MTHSRRMTRLLPLAALAVLGLFAVALAGSCTSDDEAASTPVGGERREVEAPVESIDILMLKSLPVQFRVEIVSGLPNGCHLFERYEVEREDGATDIEITVWNTIPVGDDIACAEIYGTRSGSVDLGTDFESGVEYTVIAGEVRQTFIGQ